MNKKGVKYSIKSIKCKDCDSIILGTRKGILCPLHKRERKNENNRVHYYIKYGK